MKKTIQRNKHLVLDKVTVKNLSTQQLDGVAGGVESNTLTLCLTRKTCASYEFSC